MRVLEVTVPGEPRTQGSARWVVSRSTGRAVQKKSTEEIAHRRLTAALLRQAWRRPPLPAGTPVYVSIGVFFARPKSHYLASGRLTSRAPSGLRHAQKPDADKVARLVLDALTDARIVTDDCQVASLHVMKRWQRTRGEESYTLIAVETCAEEDAHDDDVAQGVTA